MKEKIIYEKKYPVIDYVKQYEHCKEQIEDPPLKYATANEFIQAIYANTRYTPVPHREERRQEFIKGAIEVSELYQLDIQIIQYEYMVSVCLSFDFGADMKYINRLFGMADRISFFKDKSEHDFAACLDFYTHVVVRNGVSVAP